MTGKTNKVRIVATSSPPEIVTKIKRLMKFIVGLFLWAKRQSVSFEVSRRIHDGQDQ